MKSFEQIALVMYEKYRMALVRFQKLPAWVNLEEHERKAWIAAAKAAHKEITEVH